MLKMEMRTPNFTISIHLEKKKIISSLILIETNNVMVFGKKTKNQLILAMTRPTKDLCIVD